LILNLNNKFKSEDYKRILSNFLSLSILQGVNLILPLITLPYLVKVLGVELFGLLAFATTTMVYFNLLVDYGFNLTATREISIYRDNKEKLVEIFSSVMIIKFILIIISFTLLVLLVFFVEKFRQDSLVYFLTFGIVIGQALFPVWFFQGIERMKYITFLNVLSKIIFTVAVFIFINDKSDFLWVPTFTTLGFLVAGMYSLIIIKNEFKIELKRQSVQTLKNYIINGWDIFVSQIGINLYRYTNILILGIFSNNLYVGYYAIAEKLLIALQSLQAPMGQALFPFVSKKFSQLSIQTSIQLLFKYTYLVFIFLLLIYITSLVFSDYIIIFIVGDLKQNILLDFYILLPIVIIGGLNYYFGILGLTNLGMTSYFSKSVLFTGVLNLLISVPLSYIFNDTGAAISLLISETFLIINIILIIKKKYYR